jgi:hypothetical protein
LKSEDLTSQVPDFFRVAPLLRLCTRSSRRDTRTLAHVLSCRGASSTLTPGCSDTSSIAPLRVFIDTESSDESETGGVYRGQAKWARTGSSPPDTINFATFIPPNSHPTLVFQLPPNFVRYFRFTLLHLSDFQGAIAYSHSLLIYCGPVQIHLVDYLLIDN